LKLAVAARAALAKTSRKADLRKRNQKSFAKKEKRRRQIRFMYARPKD
jgi:hypothetical protein